MHAFVRMREAGTARKLASCLPVMASHRLVLWVRTIAHVGPVQSRRKGAVNSESLDGDLLADRPVIALKPSIWFASHTCKQCPMSMVITLLRHKLSIQCDSWVWWKCSFVQATRGNA